MPVIDVSDETADALFQDMLVNDYRGLREQIYNLRQKAGLEPYEQEDLDNACRYFDAIKVMMEYYLPWHQAQTLQEEQQ